MMLRPRAAQQTPPFRGREHEVQRLIRDLAFRGASPRAEISQGTSGTTGACDRGGPWGNTC